MRNAFEFCLPDSPPRWCRPAPTGSTKSNMTAIACASSATARRGARQSGARGSIHQSTRPAGMHPSLIPAENLAPLGRERELRPFVRKLQPAFSIDLCRGSEIASSRQAVASLKNY